MHLGFADLFRAAIFAAAHVFAGSLGAGIVAVSLGVRLALLPLTIRLARRALAQQAILAPAATRTPAASGALRQRPGGPLATHASALSAGGPASVRPGGRPRRARSAARARGGVRGRAPGVGRSVFVSLDRESLAPRRLARD